MLAWYWNPPHLHWFLSKAESNFYASQLARWTFILGANQLHPLTPFLLTILFEAGRCSGEFSHFSSLCLANFAQPPHIEIIFPSTPAIVGTHHPTHFNFLLLIGLMLVCTGFRFLTFINSVTISPLLCFHSSEWSYLMPGISNNQVQHFHFLTFFSLFIECGWRPVHPQATFFAAGRSRQKWFNPHSPLMNLCSVVALHRGGRKGAKKKGVGQKFEIYTACRYFLLLVAKTIQSILRVDTDHLSSLYMLWYIHENSYHIINLHPPPFLC